MNHNKNESGIHFKTFIHYGMVCVGNGVGAYAAHAHSRLMYKPKINFLNKYSKRYNICRIDIDDQINLSPIDIDRCLGT